MTTGKQLLVRSTALAGLLGALIVAAPAWAQTPVAPATAAHLSSAVQEARNAARAAETSKKDALDAGIAAKAEANRAEIAASRAATAQTTTEGIADKAMSVVENRDLAALETMGVGSTSLLDSPKGAQPFGREVDGCLTHRTRTPEWDGAFRCVVEKSRAAVRIYRKRAGLRQEITDSIAATSAVAMTAAAFKALDESTGGAWKAPFGFATVVTMGEDLSASGPRGRIYGLSAVALSNIIWRYEILSGVQSTLQSDTETLQNRVAATCGYGYPTSADLGLAEVEKAIGGDDAKPFRAVFTDHVARLRSRCELLRASVQQMGANSRLLRDHQRYLALSLAKDVTEFDDLVARLDRSVRTTPADVFSVVLAAPFAVATNLLGVGGTRPGYTSRPLPSLTGPITFRLTELPAMTLPQTLPAPMEQSGGIEAHIPTMPSKTAGDKATVERAKALHNAVVTITDQLNVLSLELGQTTAYAGQIQRLNKMSLVRINYTVVPDPVELSTPQ